MANTKMQEGVTQPSINENFVKLTGTALHIFRVPGTETVVATIATSGGGATRTNFPRCTWYGDLADEVEETVSEGDRVSIIASLQTKRFQQREGEKAIYRQNIVGQGITKAMNQIESVFGIQVENEGSYVEDENEIRLAGIAHHIFQVPNRDIVILTIRTYANGHVNMPDVKLFGRNAQYVLDEVNEGDPVCAVGFAYTNRVERADHTIGYYEGINCTSIALAPVEGM